MKSLSGQVSASNVRRAVQFLISVVAFVSLIMESARWQSNAFVNLGSIELLRSSDGRSNGDSNWFIDLGDSQDALGSSAFSKASLIYQSSCPLHRNLGRAYRSYGEYEAAIWEFERVLGICPDDVLTLFLKGEALQKKGLLQLAILDWKRAGAAPWFLGKARQAIAMKRLDLAESYLSLSLKVDPSSVESSYRLADVTWAQGRIPEAISLYEGAMSRDPAKNSYRRFFAVGQIYRVQGEWDRAITYYSKASEASPSDSSAYYMLGLSLFYGKGDAGAAVETLQKAIGLSPSDPSLYVLLGDVYRDSGEHSKALEVYLQASKLSPSDVEIHRRIDETPR